MSIVMVTKKKMRRVKKKKKRIDHIREAAKNVREVFKGVRLKISQMPYQKTLSIGQKRDAVKSSGADSDAVAMSKKLFKADEPAVKRVRAVIADIKRAYADPKHTLPFPETGVRLILEEKIAEYDLKMQELRDELQRAANALEAEMPEIRARQKERLVGLYNEADYMFDAATAYSVSWHYPSIEVPGYLMHLDPRAADAETEQIREIARREQQRLLGMFEQACKIKEDEIGEQLFAAVDSLAERLEGKNDDGKRKQFNNSTATKFFDQIEDVRDWATSVGIGRRGPLAAVFKKLEEVIQGHTKDSFALEVKHGNDEFRESITGRMAEVANLVLNKAISKDRRRAILRKPIQSAALRQE